MRKTQEQCEADVTALAVDVVQAMTQVQREKVREPLLAMQACNRAREALRIMEGALFIIATNEYDGVPTELETCMRCGEMTMRCNCTPQQIADHESDVPFA